jgi:hypothetical protein
VELRDDRRHIQVRRPRVRNSEERFESRILPLFHRKSKELGVMLPELYLHGLAKGFELAGVVCWEMERRCRARRSSD